MGGVWPVETRMRHENHAGSDVAAHGAATAAWSHYRAAKAAEQPPVIIEAATPAHCARVGCMPSKLLIAAADAAHAVGKALGFGIHVDGVIRTMDARS